MVFIFFLNYQHGQHEEGITIIESSLSTKQDDLLKDFLFALAHYGTLIKTIAQALNYVFPSLTNNTHIVSFTNDIILKPLGHLSYNIFYFLFTSLWNSKQIFHF
jgi:hypothetical protein